MKDAVRPRNEDPGKRSMDRQQWHEDDARDRRHRRNFWLHIVFDILLVAASAFLAVHFYTKQLQSEKAKLRNEVTKLQNEITTLKQWLPTTRN